LPQPERIPESNHLPQNIEKLPQNYFVGNKKDLSLREFCVWVSQTQTEKLKKTVNRLKNTKTRMARQR